ncbi:hypothetical protein MRB53_024728 [Persea americana]|uniref:Uncharacterized protein n=1 Tax=Persea americana TaxID=3435 RepID=A0ACC2LDJ8_PERAE|nr:hypothetical protein MRB53_024728 [Persea americana]
MHFRNVVSWTALLTAYAENGEIGKAQKVFDEMPKRSVASWNAMIMAYIRSKRVSEAFGAVFEDAPLESCLLLCHDHGFCSGRDVKGSRENDGIEEAYVLFKKMPKRDVVSRTSVMVRLFDRGRILESMTFLKACPQKMMLLGLRSFQGAADSHHALVVKMDLESDVSVQNALVSMHAKCGNVDDAYQIFLSIGEPILVSMNLMITGFAQHACAHAGLVEEGWNYFKSMRSSHCIEPEPDHYMCMVDLLGQVGLLKEAIGFINSMPFDPHSAVWGALLNASRTHLNLDLAKLVAQRLFELEPENATAYAVLSTMYYEAGLKREEEVLRIIKKSKGIKKSPGCSWITVNSKVHLFLAGDQSHKESTEIRAVLRNFALEVQGFGHDQMMHS